jgi:hypothetical protein
MAKKKKPVRELWEEVLTEDLGPAVLRATQRLAVDIRQRWKLIQFITALLRVDEYSSTGAWRGFTSNPPAGTPQVRALRDLFYDVMVDAHCNPATIAGLTAAERNTLASANRRRGSHNTLDLRSCQIVQNYRAAEYSIRETAEALDCSHDWVSDRRSWAKELGLVGNPNDLPTTL